MEEKRENQNDLNVFLLKIWRNFYLNNEIFKHIGLFKSNKEICINSIEDMKKYKNSDYIYKLIYNGEEKLSYGDLPRNGKLTIVEFTKLGLYQLLNEESNFSSIIPDGVSEIKFSQSNDFTPVQLSNLKLLLSTKLPNSITSIKDSSCISPLFEILPSNIKELSISFLNKSIKPNEISNNLTSIELVNWNNGDQRLQKGIFPKSLTKLSIPNYKEKLNQGVIPNSVLDLTISHPKNCVLEENTIPNSVTKLHFTSTSSSLGIILSNNKCLPNSIKELIIESNGTHIYKNSIPDSVTKLTILKPLKTNTSICKGVLPPSLKSFSISSNSYNVEIDSLPIGLTEFYYRIIQPCNLPTPEFSPSNKSFFPPSLIKVSLDIENLNLNASCFSNNLKTLILKNTQSFNSSAINSLLSLKYLEFGPGFTQKLSIGDLPPLLNELKLGNDWNNEIPIGLLPNSLKILHLGYAFNQPLIPGSLPNQLDELFFNRYGIYSHSVDQVGIFPQSLSVLQFGNSGYDKPITKSNVLPNSLKTLIWSQDLDSDNLINPNVIPNSIINLKILK